MASTDYWRKFFRSSASPDIFEVIEKAIVVAATDRADEFAARRDGIAQTLYTCRLRRCSRCCEVDGGEMPTPEPEVGRAEFEAGRVGELNEIGEKERIDEARALAEEIEEESEVAEEVLRLKEIVLNYENEYDRTLFESLRRLQLMQLSLEMLQATGIGKAVNGLRKHSSQQIADLARILVDGWKVLVSHCFDPKPHSSDPKPIIADTPPDSINPSVVLSEEEEDLSTPQFDQFPPFDEGVFLATQTEKFEFSKFFDGMDEDGNLRSNLETEKMNEREPKLGKASHERKQQDMCAEDKGQTGSRETTGQLKSLNTECRPPKTPGYADRQDKLDDTDEGSPSQEKPLNTNSRPPKPPGYAERPNKLVATDLGPGRPSKLAIEQTSGGGKQDQVGKPKKSTTSPDQSEEASTKARSEIAKSRPPKPPCNADRQNKLVGTELGPGRPSKLAKEKSGVPKKSTPLLGQSDEASMKARLEIAKRRLHEGYREAENAKRQRTTQIMELDDIPKQARTQRPPNVKMTNHIRSRFSGRR